MKYNLELSDDSVLAIIYALNEVDGDVFKGAGKPILYDDVIDLIEDQMVEHF